MDDGKNDDDGDEDINDNDDVDDDDDDACTKPLPEFDRVVKTVNNAVKSNTFL